MKRTRIYRKVNKAPHFDFNKEYTKEELIELMTDSEKVFADAYVTSGYNSAAAARHIITSNEKKNPVYYAVIGHQYRQKPIVQKYIEMVKYDFEYLVKINKARQLAEYSKIAYSNICELYKDWITLNQFDQIPDEIKAVIESIDTKVSYSLNDLKEPIETHYVKIKFYDKIKALACIDKLMGYNEPERVQVKQSTDMVIGTGSVNEIRKAFGLIPNEIE